MRSGVKVFFSGHEHNFQHSIHNGTNYFVTGGGGDLRLGQPGGFTEALTQAWGKGGHFLIVTIDGDRMTIKVIGELDGTGAIVPLRLLKPNGTAVAEFVIQR
jgi:hypothetical protein